mmetsp:Transcript_7888/g.12868  ORF Transcript_7888/g.12868 Transcript_7888/m.12868 type:complete len:202 (-) Transcript_7888:51-656(-)
MTRIEEHAADTATVAQNFSLAFRSSSSSASCSARNFAAIASSLIWLSFARGTVSAGAWLVVGGLSTQVSLASSHWQSPLHQSWPCSCGHAAHSAALCLPHETVISLSGVECVTSSGLPPPASGICCMSASWRMSRRSFSLDVPSTTPCGAIDNWTPLSSSFKRCFWLCLRGLCESCCNVDTPETTARHSSTVTMFIRSIMN